MISENNDEAGSSTRTQLPNLIGITLYFGLGFIAHSTKEIKINNKMADGKYFMESKNL